MQKKILSSILAGALAVSLFTANVFADDEIVLKPDEPTGLTKVSNPESEVTFKKVNASKDWTVGGESDGQWLLGGDNGDIGISLETLQKYEAIEIDYTCDNPIEGTKIGFAFKIHVDMESRTCEDGGYIFADYLPATWVPYGSGMMDEKQPIKAVNSLETIYQTQVKEEGTLSVKIADLLAIFPEDMDYMMAIGIGADNKNDDIAEEDDDEEYTVDVLAIRFGAATVTEEPEPEKTEAETEAPKETEAQAPASNGSASTSAATTANTGSSSSEGSNNVGLIVGIVAGIVVIGGGIGVVSFLKKK